MKQLFDKKILFLYPKSSKSPQWTFHLWYNTPSITRPRNKFCYLSPLIYHYAPNDVHTRHSNAEMPTCSLLATISWPLNIKAGMEEG